MWRTLKIFLFLWPIPVIAYFIGSSMVDQSDVDKKLREVHTLVWKCGDNHTAVNVTKTSQGELNSYEIVLVDINNNTLHKDLFVVDTDMFGGGFVKTVQADNDQDMELIVWGSHEREKSYLLDCSGGKIKKTDFDKLPEEILQLTRQWHQAYVTNRMTLVFLGILAIGYYGMLTTIWLIIKAVQFFKKRKV